MAHYDITAEVTELIEKFGYTPERIKALSRRIDDDIYDGEWTAGNRAAESAVVYELDEARDKASRKPRRNSASDEAWRIGRSYGINGQVWDNA